MDILWFCREKACMKTNVQEWIMHIWDLLLSSTKGLHIQNDSRSTSALESTHGLFPLKRMTRLSFKYCQGFSGSGSSVLSPSLPLDIHSRLLFIFRHLWWRCQWFYCTWFRHLLFIALFSSSKGPREHWDEWEFTHLIKTSASTVKNRWIRREKECEGIFFFHAE